VVLGSTRLLQEMDVSPGALQTTAQRLESEGRTISWLARLTEAGAELLGLLALGGMLKPTAHAAVRGLQELGIRTLMLTGDNPRSAC
jgi:Cu+-exporting ATPase